MTGRSTLRISHVIQELSRRTDIRKMEQNSPSPVSVLPVLSREKKVTGIVNLTDMLKRGFI
ncbi:hypothetical protein LFZ15_16035 [Salmonella enterica subsp. enterica serovar Hvittingfoss str. SA20014981]|nr:hypothetical protein LFZ15_16035 [Salmonella enterica subsp. enterica serovar Hvittingfoss str. SA20014981]